MSLAEILRKNAEFVKERASGPPLLPPKASGPLVVTCSDPGLTGLIEDALGIRPSRGCVVRMAGAWGGPMGQELSRSVLMAVHASGCDQILVVGHSGCDCCPVDRGKLRDSLKLSGLDAATRGQDGGPMEIVRGPATPRAAVLETVRLLRAASWRPSELPVHGCMLDPDSGLLQVIDQDELVLPEAPEEPVLGASIDVPDIPLPELPEILFPEIPEFNIEAIADSPAPPKKKKAKEYGLSQPDAGPVSFIEMLNRPQTQARDMGANKSEMQASSPVIQGVGFQVPDIQFQVPKAADIQDTGMGSRPGVEAKERVKKRQRVEARADVTARPATPRRRVATQASPEQASPAPQASAQRPLQERVIDFDEEKTPVPQTRSDLHVDLDSGYVTHRGTEHPLDPELQQALLKVMRFIASEFTRQQRSKIMGQIVRGANTGQPFGELLKLMISPILKLGKRRYAVINELLKLKEDLPRQDPNIAGAILQKLLEN